MIYTFTYKYLIMKIFENTCGIDFPFYNGIPKLSKFDWIILAIGPILTLMTIFGITDSIPGMGDILTAQFTPIWFCLITLLPVTYVCRGKLQIFFRIPKLGDIKIILACFILNSVYTIGVAALLDTLGFKLSENTSTIAHAIFTTNNLLVVIQLIGEELFKVSLLLCIMVLIYHFSNNRKVSVVISTLVVMLVFGLMHLPAYNWSFIQSLVLIGLSTIFDLFPYLKTKNVTNSYIVHLMIDLVPTLM